jgi:hypothetical protein
MLLAVSRRREEIELPQPLTRPQSIHCPYLLNPQIDNSSLELSAL